MPDASWGGPGVESLNLVKLKRIGGLPLRVRSEVAPIFQYLIDELQKPGYRKAGAPALDSSGGYNKRYISGTTKWSNHSWGLAVDLNAVTNPYSYTLRTDFVPDKVNTLVRALGIRWGYNYSGKKDPMHFEYMGSMADARELVVRLNKLEQPTMSTLKMTLENKRYIQNMPVRATGVKFNPGNVIVSADGKNRFTLQEDGNAVIYVNEIAVWSMFNLTKNVGANYLLINKGVIKAIRDGKTICTLGVEVTELYNNGYVSMQDDGNLVYRVDVSTWWSGTNKK